MTDRDGSTCTRRGWLAVVASVMALPALAKRGHEIHPFEPPVGTAKLDAEREYQQAELARSIAFCRHTLGLGVR